VREINFARLRSDAEENIWDLPFFSTSDSEDNDTESEDEGENDIKKTETF
jgi:hypothetical protein